MPRKKGTPNELTTIPLDGPDAAELIEDLMESYASQSVDAITSVIAFETALLHVAQTMAGQAIVIAEHTTEADRVKAAERQAKLLVRLFNQLLEGARG